MLNGLMQLNLMTDEEIEAALAKPADGIYVVPNHTGKNWFHLAMPRVSGIMFKRGDENIILLAFGHEAAKKMEEHKSLGLFVKGAAKPTA